MVSSAIPRSSRKSRSATAGESPESAVVGEVSNPQGDNLNLVEGVKRHLVEKDIRPLWLEEKEVIERAIEICEDNIPKAAAFLDVSASTIYRKKQQWENLMKDA